MIFHLELVHYLENIRNRRSYTLSLSSAALTAYIPVQRNHAVLDAVFDSVLPPVLNEGGVQVLIDRLVQVGIDVFCFSLHSGRQNRNFIGNNPQALSNKYLNADSLESRSSRSSLKSVSLNHLFWEQGVLSSNLSAPTN